MNDTLQTYYDKHNSRLPTEPIPDEAKESKDDKALKSYRCVLKTKLMITS